MAVSHRARASVAGLALAVLLAPTSFAPARCEASPRCDQTTETWPDGKPKRRFSLDPDGKLQGEYFEWWGNGRLAVRTWYEHGGVDGVFTSFHDNGLAHVTTRYLHGKLNGAYVELAADGKPYIEASYTDGALDGKRTIRRDGAPVSVQLWKKGELVDLMGAVPYPQSLATIHTGLAAIAVQTQAKIDDGSPPPPPPPDPKAKKKKTPDKAKEKKGEKAARVALPIPDGYAPDVDTLLPKRFAALKRLQEYRVLAGVAWQDVALLPRYDYFCDWGSRLLEHVGHLEHTPPNPGVPDLEYQDGFTGTSNSNLFSNHDMYRSVDAYMDDSDDENIDRVGHRRHCLHPQLRVTGFGTSDHYSAMWSLDRSRALAKLPATVSWPPAGFMSARHFAVRHAWHCSFFGEAALPAKGDLDVRVYPMDELFVPAETPLELDYKNVNGDAVIFRPVLTGELAGRRFWVEIADAPVKGKTTRYLVEFVKLEE